MSKEFNIGDIVYYFDIMVQADHYGFVIDSTDHPPWLPGNKQYRIRLFKPTIHSYDLVWVDQENLFASIENTNE